MFSFSPFIAGFIHKHPTFKMLGFVFFGDDRVKPCNRRMGFRQGRRPSFKKLYLFRDGIFICCGSIEYGNDEKTKPAEWFNWMNRIILWMKLIWTTRRSNKLHDARIFFTIPGPS